MRPERARQILRDIIAEIDGVQGRLGQVSLAGYSADWATKRAVERGIEIISEASRRLPRELCDRAPEIEWKEIRGIGNVLRHDYDDVVDQIIYDVVKERLPAPQDRRPRHRNFPRRDKGLAPQTGGAAALSDDGTHTMSVGL